MRILIIEDQPIAAMLLQRMLEKMGHEVVCAGDGVEAWQILAALDIRLVVSDWVMPRMDGLELCRRIRERKDRPYIYVILLTSRDGHEDRLMGLRAGADDLLAKPPDPSELEIRLEIARRILSVQEELERKNALLAELAAVDPLTGLRNRRVLPEAFQAAAASSRRQGLPLSVIMLDVDHFKLYNDAFGHPAGDEILRQVARVLVETVRTHDVTARYGGEEFVVILPGTGEREARLVAERIRSAIERYGWPLRPITASLGVATAPADVPSHAQLLDRADQALYRSKHSGRNRVTAHESDPARGEGQAALTGA